MNLNTFVRTPERRPDYDGDGLYIAHSVPSLRNAPKGVTFDEIYDDHIRQCAADASLPPTRDEAAAELIAAIEAGIVETMRPA